MEPDSSQGRRQSGRQAGTVSLGRLGVSRDGIMRASHGKCAGRGSQAANSKCRHWTGTPGRRDLVVVRANGHPIARL